MCATVLLPGTDGACRHCYGFCQDNLSVCQFASLPVCQFASLPVCQFVGLSAKVSAIISLKGVFDVLITMVPSELPQNVPFGRYKYF